MTIRDVTHDGNVKGTVLEECPCGYDFDEGEERHMHIETHNPEDFGLTPMRTGQQSLTSFEEQEVMPDGGT